MNFQSNPVFSPIRVLVTNPLSDTGQLVITKIMSGLVFAPDQLIDLILLVYSNERQAAEDLESELYGCSFGCMNTITVSTDVPLLEDADVFCFITYFQNPNYVDFDNIDNDEFDVLYLIIKIAISLAKSSSEPKKEEIEDNISKQRIDNEQTKPRKPIIMTDGVVTMNILRYLTRESLPSDVLFCPSPLPATIKAMLGEHLKVPASDINDILAWGANDEVFHFEVARPVIVHNEVNAETHCDLEIIGKEMVRRAGLDSSQFNESWLRKEFKEKVQVTMSKNPYGNIYRAAEFAKTLSIVWKTRSGNASKDMKVFASLGVISDGSLSTIKDFAYVLPLIFTGDTWNVDTRFKDCFHLQQEIKRINRTVKELKAKLYPYCKRFLEDNVINQAFIPASDTSILTRQSM